MRYTKTLGTAGSVAALALLALALCLTGCSQVQVNSMQSGQAVALNADDIVRVMQRAGFSDEQILDRGTELRNQLAAAGAAQVRVGPKVEAIFLADKRQVIITSRKGGNCIYNLDTGYFQ
jgi:hypothetical protein